MNRAPRTDVPAAPPCTTWCDTHEPGDGWDYSGPSATTKTCVHTITIGAALIQLERFAAIEFGRVVVKEPAVRLSIDDAVSLAEAQVLADALLGAVDSMRLTIAS